MTLNLELICGRIDSITMFSLPVGAQYFHILRLILKQLFHHIIPLFRNPSWQTFTIGFSNSFPEPLAQVLFFRPAHVLSSGQTFPTLLLCLPSPRLPRLPRLLSRLYLIKVRVLDKTPSHREHSLPYIHSMYCISSSEVILLCNISCYFIF